MTKMMNAVLNTISGNQPEITNHNGMMNTVLGLLAKGDMNCAGEEVNPNGDLFGQKAAATTTADIHQKARTANEIKSGVVITEAEKLKAEEEKRRQEEEEAARKAEEEAAEAARKAAEEKKKKENSGLKKFGSKFKSFLNNILTEEE